MVDHILRLFSRGRICTIGSYTQSLTAQVVNVCNMAQHGLQNERDIDVYRNLTEVTRLLLHKLQQENVYAEMQTTRRTDMSRRETESYAEAAAQAEALNRSLQQLHNDSRSRMTYHVEEHFTSVNRSQSLIQSMLLDIHRSMHHSASASITVSCRMFLWSK